MGPSLDDELVQLKRTIDAPGGVLHFWENVLTSQQRRQLSDDVNQAHQRHGGSTGIWVTLHGGSVERAIVDVAHEMGLIAAAKHRRLLRFLNEQVEATPQGDKPSWDAASGKLFLDGEIARRLRRLRSPTNVEQILNAFQQAGWPAEVENPLGGDAQTLHQALRSLHQGLRGLRFHSHQGGEFVSWERA